MPRKNKDIFEVFFRKKPALILISLRKHQKHKYGSVLAKEADCTYSHAVKILQDMEKAKLISFEKQGRIKNMARPLSIFTFTKELLFLLWVDVHSRFTKRKKR